MINAIRAFGDKLFIVNMKNKLATYNLKWSGQDEIRAAE